MTKRPGGSVKSTVSAGALFGFLCGMAALVVFALWWKMGPDSVSCYYASYEPGDDTAFAGMATKMWPTRWVWIGVVVAPTLAGVLLGVLAARFGLRVERVSE
ncbi:hypothetical protein NLM24_19885 [Nocardia zapadnayensis]|uniref:hypothetical protein n=1 Tax=Nocardia rhamnosiphila TaxID=426716 RepID=UPI002246EFE4|nr:hypothetical protein [Nocardia zapadnayensis]MCX0272924.1 hypothetical protein [Nocardia zapadnayensis]